MAFVYKSHSLSRLLQVPNYESPSFLSENAAPYWTPDFSGLGSQVDMDFVVWNPPSVELNDNAGHLKDAKRKRGADFDFASLFGFLAAHYRQNLYVLLTVLYISSYHGYCLAHH